jgi:hypothetical protein
VAEGKVDKFVNRVKFIVQGTVKNNDFLTLPDPLLQQLPCSLDLRNILKTILRNEKKGSRIEIYMEKIGRFFKSAEIPPFPQLLPFLRLQQNTLVFQAEDERILESGRFLINAQGQQPSDGNPEKKPQHGKNKERQGLYPLQCKENGRQNSKNIDKDSKDLYFRPGKKVAP